MDYIQLKPSSVKRFGIRTADGVDTGEYIEIDIEDIELPKRAEICHKKHAENVKKLNEIKENINKEEDRKEKDEVFSNNEKILMNAFQEFYQKEEEAIDELLGKGTTRKLLNGRKPYVTMYEDISDYIEQIIPILKESQAKLIDKIKSKYSKEEEDNIL